MTAWENLKGMEERDVYHKDVSLFYKKIETKEMPYLKKINVEFRIPNPGLVLKDGLLYANSPLKNVEIRYTTDGTIPTENSALWEKPVACKAKVIKARTFYLKKMSTVTTISNI